MYYTHEFAKIIAHVHVGTKTVLPALDNDDRPKFINDK